jgi:hypothetical protein
MSGHNGLQHDLLRVALWARRMVLMLTCEMRDPFPVDNGHLYSLADRIEFLLKFESVQQLQKAKTDVGVVALLESVCKKLVDVAANWDGPFRDQCSAGLMAISRFIQSGVKSAAATQEEWRRITLDNESLDLILVGEAIKVAAEAGQIFKPTIWGDWGIDGEIEFKDRRGKASGKRVYLQLKSGDSHLRKRKDGTEVFQIKNVRHLQYWQQHAYPVMLVIRASDGTVRWMDVSACLKGKKRTRQIAFEGEPFTALSVRRMRDGLIPRRRKH